jgi:hypothetical protein
MVVARQAGSRTGSFSLLFFIQSTYQDYLENIGKSASGNERGYPFPAPWSYLYPTLFIFQS